MSFLADLHARHSDSGLENPCGEVLLSTLTTVPVTPHLWLRDMCTCSQWRSRAIPERHMVGCPVRPREGLHGGMREVALGWSLGRYGMFSKRISKGDDGYTVVEVSQASITDIALGRRLDSFAWMTDIVLSDFFYPPGAIQEEEPRLSIPHPDDADDVAADVGFGGVKR